MRFDSLLGFAAAIAALLSSSGCVQAKLHSEAPRRALIVSIDGLRPDLLSRADVPHVRALIGQGAYTLRARTTDVGYTVPSHVSMLTGVTPEVHGVTWNHHIEDAYPQVPTLLELARRAGRTTALVVGKTKLIVLTKPGTLNWSHVGDETLEHDADIGARAAAVIRSHRPEVMFVHLADVDTVGHASGWGSPAQLHAIAEADRAFGTLMEALDASGVARQTLIVLTADHGGVGVEHPPEDPESQRVPWIVAGPSIRRNFHIDDVDVSITATFAVVSAMLGLEASSSKGADFPRAILDADALLLPRR